MAALLIGACSPPQEIEPQKLVVIGSSTATPLAEAIARHFETERPGVRVVVEGGGSHRGLSELREGSCDVGLVSRALRADESDLLAWPIARDGLGFIVHQDRPWTSIDADKVKRIWRGELRHWHDQHRSVDLIHPVSMSPGRSTQEIFLDRLELSEAEIRPMIVVSDHYHAVRTVATDHHAIAYVSIAVAEEQIQDGAPIRLLTYEGVLATSDNVRNNSYPLTRTLSMVTHNRPSGLVMDWLSTARSPAMDAILERLHLVSLDP